MRLLLTFIIFIFGGFYTFGKENCCEQCCEYLGNCCKKGKVEVKNGNNVEENKKEGEDNVKGNKEENKKEGEEEEEFYLKKSEATDSKEIGKLVSSKWYSNKGKEASFILYEKINGAVNQNLNENDVIKVKKDKNGFTIDENFILENDNNTQKWALFEIIYKEEEKEKETKYLYCSDIEGIGSSEIFSNCQQHVSISVIACDTSGVTDMCSMFYECSSLTELDLSNFKTDNVKDMTFMFSGCASLQQLDLSNFNTENVTDMSSMFYGCASLQQLNLSNFNTEKVTDMNSMFGSCNALTKIIFGDKFNTDNVTNMSSMFFDCSSLMKLNFSKFNTKNVTNMSDMFSGCSSLTELDFSKFNTKNVTNMSNMFSDCSSLTELDLSNFDTKNVEKMSFMFFECNSLQTVTFNKNLNENIKQQLNKLGLTESEEEGNKITLKKQLT